MDADDFVKYLLDTVDSSGCAITIRECKNTFIPCDYVIEIRKGNFTAERRFTLEVLNDSLSGVTDTFKAYLDDGIRQLADEIKRIRAFRERVILEEALGYENKIDE